MRKLVANPGIDDLILVPLLGIIVITRDIHIELFSLLESSLLLIQFDLLECILFIQIQGGQDKTRVFDMQVSTISLCCCNYGAFFPPGTPICIVESLKA
jgi:hypothetical protein